MSEYKNHTANDSRHFIQGVLKHPGALRKTLGIKQGKTIPVARLKAAAKGNSVTARRARFAITLRKLRGG